MGEIKLYPNFRVRFTVSTMLLFNKSPYWHAVLPSPGRTFPQRQTCQFLEVQWSPLSSPAGHQPSVVGKDCSHQRRCQHWGPGEVKEGCDETHGRGQLLHNHKWKSGAQRRLYSEDFAFQLGQPPLG